MFKHNMFCGKCGQETEHSDLSCDECEKKIIAALEEARSEATKAFRRLDTAGKVEVLTSIIGEKNIADWILANDSGTST